MSLSDKTKHNPKNLRVPSIVYLEEDIKQAVKELKEELLKPNQKLRALQIIEKIFGDKLI